MDRHYAEPLSLELVARQAGYSRFHFLRAFREAYGETPRAYLTAGASSGPRTSSARPT